jgi:sec-independent protein translocase protein TatA
MIPTGASIAMIPGGVGAFEMLLLFAVVLVLFGPKHLPVFARQLGKLVSQCQKAAAFFQNQLLHMDDHEEEPDVAVDATIKKAPSAEVDAARKAGGGH